MSKDIDEQFKLAHKVVEVVDRANRKICVTLPRYNIDKPESFCPQIRLLARKKEDEEIQYIVYVKCKLEEFIYLLDVMTSFNDKTITNQPTSIDLVQKINSFTLYHFCMHSNQDELEQGR